MVVSDSIDRQIESVRDLLRETLSDTSLGRYLGDNKEILGAGKLLRSRLAWTVGTAAGTPPEILLHASAAVETLHAASLLHDDVIDGAAMRRRAPAFWQERGTSGAILLGDLFLCLSIELVGKVEEGRLTPLFIGKAREMCDAESEQELILRGREGDLETSLSLCRRKTGCLFAFAARAAAWNQTGLEQALEEAGYLIGTAYQVADDLLDVSGNTDLSGKTLGTDAARNKLTAASASRSSGDGQNILNNLIERSCTLLADWPDVQLAWKHYVETDIRPTIEPFTKGSMLETVGR